MRNSRKKVRDVLANQLTGIGAKLKIPLVTIEWVIIILKKYEIIPETKPKFISSVSIFFIICHLIDTRINGPEASKCDTKCRHWKYLSISNIIWSNRIKLIDINTLESKSIEFNGMMCSKASISISLASSSVCQLKKIA